MHLNVLNRSKGIPYYWIILVVATCSQMSVSFVPLGISALAPFFVIDLGVNKTQVGFLGGAVNVGMAFTSLLVGVLVDRLGEKRVLVAGGLLTGLTVLVASRVGSFSILLMLLVLTGFWAASATPAGSKGIMYWFPSSWIGFALGFRQTGLPLGGALSALVLPALAVRYGWQGALLCAGGVAIFGALLVFIFYRENRQVKRREGQHSDFKLQLKGLVCYPDLWLISGAALILAGTQFTVVSYIELFYHEGLKQTIRFASYMLALTQLAGMGGRIFWGVLSDRYFNGVRKYPFLLVILLIAAMCIIMSFLRPGLSWWLLVIISWSLGFTAIGWNGLFIAMISELAGSELAGTALGISLTVTQFGVLLIPPLFGFIVDHTGLYRGGWTTLLAFLLLSLFLISRVNEKKVV